MKQTKLFRGEVEVCNLLDYSPTPGWSNVNLIQNYSEEHPWQPSELEVDPPFWYTESGIFNGYLFSLVHFFKDSNEGPLKEGAWCTRTPSGKVQVYTAREFYKKYGFVGREDKSAFGLMGVEERENINSGKCLTDIKEEDPSYYHAVVGEELRATDMSNNVGFYLPSLGISIVNGIGCYPDYSLYDQGDVVAYAAHVDNPDVLIDKVYVKGYSDEENIWCSAYAILRNSFYNNKSMRTLCVSGEVGRIEKEAFHDCMELEEVTITSTAMEELRAASFVNCPKLKRVNLSNHIKLIGTFNEDVVVSYID